MAAPTGGLTTSIRRKLQEGRTPEEIVQELVAGGLGQVSAQRFVDRALAEDATAAPLPPAPPMPDQAEAPADALDQFIQTKTAETEAANAKTGRASLWAGSLLMCGGILITAFSYIMANPGERYTLMWGPVVFGFLIWGQSVLKGFANFRTFAWFSAVASIIVPVVLTVFLLGIAVANEPTEEELQAALAGAAEAAPDYEIPVVDAENLTEVIRDFDIASNPAEKCALANALSKFRGDGRAWVAVELSNRARKMPDRWAAQKLCTAEAVMTLDGPTGVKLYEDWRQGEHAALKNAAEVVLANH